MPRAATPLSFQEFERVYARFLAPVRAKCRRMLPHAADDVTQEVFVRFWQWRERPAMDAPDAPRTLLAWLYRTSTRLAIDVLRARAPNPEDAEQVASLPCGIDLDAALAAKSAILAVCRVARDDELEAAVLARIDGLSHPEVALVLGISERTVRRLLQRFDERTNAVRKEFVP